MRVMYNTGILNVLFLLTVNGKLFSKFKTAESHWEIAIIKEMLWQKRG
jgi:hypothetical protein